MLKGPEEDDRILYASHTIWQTEEHFRTWTASAEFRTSHAKAGQNRKLHEGAPHFEGFARSSRWTLSSRPERAALSANQSPPCSKHAKGVRSTGALIHFLTEKLRLG